MNAGETLGVVGESGCGKSTMGRSVLRLLEPTNGQVLFEGKDYTALKSSELAKSRSDLQIIFQDPYASLDPRMTIGDIIGEPLDIQLKLPTKERMERVLKTMERVGPVSYTHLDVYKRQEYANRGSKKDRSSSPFR